MRGSLLRRLVPAAAILSVLAACGPAGPAAPAAPVPAGAIRRPVDPVGYTHSAAGIARVVAHARGLEWPALGGGAPATQGAPFVGAIAPHDDYLYAQRVYAHVFPYLTARDVVVIGVAHQARDFPEVEGKLVFDSAAAWHGPYGPVPASPLRGALLDRLRDNTIIHDRLQAVEHSVEGLVPFLQHHRRDVRIVPILVPYMSWERLAALVDRAGAALADVMRPQGLVLGRDVAILVSSDAVHYGDLGWGAKPHADFGVGADGYRRAVDRDLALIGEHLTGPAALPRLEGLYRKLVGDDFHEYRITWCGRFSVPFGVGLMARTAAGLGGPAPTGALLRYGTTLDPGRSDPGVSGLGVTAPATLRHWVGFAAIGYR
jgi:AmmeMemoRadiSam system protein B